MADDSSSEEQVMPAVKKEVPSKPAKAKAKVEEDSDSDEDIPARGAPKKPAKAPVAENDSSSEEDVPAKGVVAKAAKAKVEEDSDSEAEKDVKVLKAKTKTAKAKVEQDSDSEEEKDVKVGAASQSKAPVVEEDSDDDDVEAAPTITLTQKASAVEEDSDDEDETPPAKQKTKAKLEAKTPEKPATKIDNGIDNPDSLRVFVQGLPFTVKDQEIKDAFKKCGFIKYVKLLKGKDDKPKGTAFIGLKTEEAVQVALKLDGNETKFPGRKLSVERAKDKVQNEVSKDSKNKKNKDKNKSDSKDTSEATFKLGENSILTEKLLKALIQANNSEDFGGMENLGAKIMRLAKAASENKAKQMARIKSRKDDVGKFSVFVTGLPVKDFDEEALKARFIDCGVIKSVWLPLNKDGAIKGFGAITFKTEEAFKKALAYNGTKCKGSVMTVRESKPQEKRQSDHKGETVENNVEEGKKGKRQVETQAEPVQEDVKPAKKSKKAVVEESTVEASSKSSKKQKDDAKDVEVEPVVKKSKKDKVK